MRHLGVRRGGPHHSARGAGQGWILTRRVAAGWIVMLAFGATVSGEDWPSFLGPNRDGKSRTRNIRTDWRDGKLPVRWTCEIGEGYSGGAVAGGRYYRFDRQANQTRLTALDAQTGRVVWQFAYPTTYRDQFGYDGGPRSSPVVDGERVYMYGVDGCLYCLAAADGGVLWKLDTMQAFGVVPNFFGVGSTPLVYEDLLLVMVGGSPEASHRVPAGDLNRVRPNGSAIVALDKATGDVRYRTGDDLASYSSPVVRTISGRPWCLAFCRDKLLGLDPPSGRIGFEFPWRARKLFSVNASTPVVVGDRIFISESYERGGVLLELDGPEVRVVWQDERRKQSLAAHWNTPIEVDGYLYGCHGERRGSAELRCIDLATGQVRWSQPGLERTSLTWVDGRLVCLSEAGRLLLLDANPERFTVITEFVPTGEQVRAGARLTYPCWAAPLIADGMMYVRGQGRLLCLQLTND